MIHAYEVHGMRDDGSIFGAVAFERDGADEREADAKAGAVAEYYAKLWQQAASVKLYRTPKANMGSVSSFNLWPGRVVLITEIRGSSERRGL
jgi:hypothetical protein